MCIRSLVSSIKLKLVPISSRKSSKLMIGSSLYKWVNGIWALFNWNFCLFFNGGLMFNVSNHCGFMLVGRYGTLQAKSSFKVLGLHFMEAQIGVF